VCKGERERPGQESISRMNMKKIDRREEKEKRRRKSRKKQEKAGKSRKKTG
jgi:hypothetical protein